MRDADQRGVPIIGHCLGGQLLAKAFGAPVTRSAMKEIGWSEVEVDDAELAREWMGDRAGVRPFSVAWRHVFRARGGTTLSDEQVMRESGIRD